MFSSPNLISFKDLWWSYFLIPQSKTTIYINSSHHQLLNYVIIYRYKLEIFQLYPFFTVNLKHFNRTPKKLFHYSNRKVNIIHCHLRNNIRILNADLHKDFVRENSIFENCGYQSKNVYHFFFECPCYDVERYTLFKCISYMGLQHPVTLKMLLFGDSSISHSINFALFNFKHTYMLQTN